LLRGSISPILVAMLLAMMGVGCRYMVVDHTDLAVKGPLTMSSPARSDVRLASSHVAQHGGVARTGDVRGCDGVIAIGPRVMLANVCDPDRFPFMMSSQMLSAPISAVAQDGGHAFVTTDDGYLYRIGKAAWSHAPISTLPVADGSSLLALDANRAYVADRTGAISIVDTTNLDRLIHRFTFYMATIRSTSNILGISTTDSALLVLLVDSTVNEYFVYALHVPELATSADDVMVDSWVEVSDRDVPLGPSVVGDRAYVVLQGTEIVKAIDVSDPESLVIAEEWVLGDDDPLLGSIVHFDADERGILVAWSGSGGRARGGAVKRYNHIGDKLELIWTLARGGWTPSWVSNSYDGASSIALDGGLVVDLLPGPESGESTPLASTQLPAPWIVSVHGEDHPLPAFVTSRSSGLWQVQQDSDEDVLRLSLVQPEVVRSAGLLPDGRLVGLSNTELFVQETASHGMEFSRTLLSSIGVPDGDRVRALEVLGSSVAIVSTPRGPREGPITTEVTLVDLSASSRPTSTSTVFYDRASADVPVGAASVGNTLVVANLMSEPILIDYRDVESPIVVRASPDAGVVGTLSSDGTYLAATSDEDVVVFEVDEEPLSLKKLSGLSVGSLVKAVAIDGSRLVVARLRLPIDEPIGVAILEVFEISEGGRLVRIGESINLPGTPSDMHLVGDSVLIGTEDAGVVYLSPPGGARSTILLPRGEVGR